MISIIPAKEEHIPILIPLMDEYRIFYRQSSDETEVKKFLEARIKNKESIIFIAYFDDNPAGFVQLYTSFSTVSLKPVFILNDLYVYTKFRKKGVGEILLKSAKEYCRLQGYKGLALETEIDNPAQKLYERLGWEKDSGCFHYFWKSN
jgi:GNAT superfamily N-acetyltransferase